MFMLSTATSIFTKGFISLQRLSCLLLLLGLCSSSLAQEINIRGLMMPGELHTHHAKLENDCESCHTPFDKKQQKNLCLSCHEKIDSDLLTQKGMHGKFTNDTCNNCHSEHKGRTGIITEFDPNSFTHAQTNFPLLGKHSTTTCKQCHQKDLAYSEASTECHECHQAQSPHQNDNYQVCANCHRSTDWHTVVFDHSSTKFPLRAAHASLNCSSCHISQSNFALVGECKSCHAIDDVHKGAYGLTCVDCHNQSQWSDSLFHHERDTGYALHGKHEGLSCSACHSRSTLSEVIGKRCNDCHQGDNPHLGRFSSDCQRCHAQERWKIPHFSHTKYSDFELLGAHAQVSCKRCHNTDNKLSPGRQCSDCHATNDPHRGSEGLQCQRCHQQNSWYSNVAFDHDITSFPLIGLHAGIACESCHLNAEFSKTRSSCIACHQQNDIHAGNFGKQCHRCHTPNDWQLWFFNHSSQTNFVLHGAHESLRCMHCHRNSSHPAASCGNCHSDDDPHDGQFSLRCDRCHNQSSFKKVTD